MAMASAGSMEYRALIKCFDKLATAFKLSLVTISSELIANGFISSEMCDEVLATSGLNEDVKATKLVKHVIDMIKVFPGRYSDFMALPLFQREQLSPIHDAVMTEYGKAWHAKLYQFVRLHSQLLILRVWLDRLHVSISVIQVMYLPSSSHPFIRNVEDGSFVSN